MGYARVRMNGKIITVSEATMLEDHEIGTEMEIVVDRIVLDKKVPDVERIIDSLENCHEIGRKHDETGF